jgi:Arc/MetJ family transcription regulator
VRTTITLDPDVEALVAKAMRERGLSFKQAVNDALRRALTGPAEREPYRTPTYAMGPATVDVDKALRLAGELETEELLAKARLGK